jgi:GT2 family glycosyltransferase
MNDHALALDTIHVQCVYGAQHLPHITRVLLPALARTTRRPIVFSLLNYDGNSAARPSEGSQHGVAVRCIPNVGQHVIGFAEGHNRIFRHTEPLDCFVLLNPDCIPQPGSIDALLSRYATTSAKTALVEGRQWPFAHPKEYDELTLQTPWASGAFCLVDATFYASIGGMDELYFLYLEDVDLSWRAWLSGYQVLYEPSAAVTHFTGGRFYRSDLISNEALYSPRNFLLISRKFFGEAGEARARAMLGEWADSELATFAINKYDQIDTALIDKRYSEQRHERVKILGYIQFHDMKDK